MDNELLLFDRVNIIRDTIKKYGEQNFYLSFSGGKDSTVLHHLIDMALPNNKIPRLFINTGIEYVDVVKFVKALAEKDGRIVMLPPAKSIRQVLTEYGYPFKSKEHSQYLSIYQHSGLGKTVNNYLGSGRKTRFLCPNCLKYQFTPDFKLKVSDQCCHKMKKETAAKWAKQNGKTITITGMRNGEGGIRASHGKGCAVFDENGGLVKFHPLKPVDDAFEDWLIKRENIELCRLYYPPFNFKRTGCKGCPFSINLEDQLEVMEQLLPGEAKQCELIWGPVYAEYRKIGYRLKPCHQVKIILTRS